MLTAVASQPRTWGDRPSRNRSQPGGSFSLIFLGVRSIFSARSFQGGQVDVFGPYGRAFGHGVAVVGSQGRQPLDEEIRSRTASPGRGDRTVRPGGQVHVFGRRVSARSILSAEKWTRPRRWSSYSAERYSYSYSYSKGAPWPSRSSITRSESPTRGVNGYDERWAFTGRGLVHFSAVKLCQTQTRWPKTWT